MLLSKRLPAGPYGEVLPPPLVAGVTPDEALARLGKAARDIDSPITIPSRGKSLDGMYNLALLYVHQFNLREAMAGRLDDPDALALHEAIVEHRQPLSLRPVGMEALEFTSFAPVLQRINGTRWRIGQPDCGWTAETDVENPAEALEWAWALYVQWAEDEEVDFRYSINKMLRQVPFSFSHLHWAYRLRTDGSIDVAQGIAVKRLGQHRTYRLTTFKGDRVIQAGKPERVVRIAESMAQQMHVVEVYHPQAPEVVETLVLVAGVPLPIQGNEGVWHMGETRARWEGKPRRTVLLIRGKTRCVVSVAPPHNLVLSRVLQGGVLKQLAKVALVEAQRKWLTDPNGKTAIIMWAADVLQKTWMSLDD